MANPKIDQALLFSDLHESWKHLDNLNSLLKEQQFKLVIFAGDFLNMGETLGFARKFVEVFLRNEAQLVWVPGNNDFGHGYHLLNSKFRSLEGKVVTISGRKFCGVGGSPASWAGQYSGQNMIDQVLVGGSIFVSHVPPPGNLSYQKNDCASPTGRKFSDSPLVHICGHIHTNWGCAFLGQTKVVKLAPLLFGHYAIMNLENLSVEFRRFRENSYLR